MSAKMINIVSAKSQLNWINSLENNVVGFIVSYWGGIMDDRNIPVHRQMMRAQRFSEYIF